MVVRFIPMAALTKRGRPRRSPIEEVRTAAWFDDVMDRAITKTTAELERKFATTPAKPESEKRPSRWAKYRYGATSPSAELVDRVNRSYLRGKEVYNHPLWELASSEALSPSDLRELVSQVEDYGPLMCNVSAVRSGSSLFWLPAHFDYRAVIHKVEFDATSPVRHQSSYLGRLATLCGLVHDAAIRQRQEQHFEAHVALARHGGLALRASKARHWHGKLEALLLVRWLGTEYQDPQLRRLLESYRKIDFGVIHTARLRGSASSLRPARNTQSRSSRQAFKRGRWIIEAIEKSVGALSLRAAS